jgi:hypothetical protein
MEFEGIRGAGAPSAPRCLHGSVLYTYLFKK